MATSRCIKCDSSSFEAVEAVPKNSEFKLIFVQCASCGGVVGVMDYYNIGSETQDIKRLLKNRSY